MKTLLIGSGLSAWSVLTSLENLENVYLIDGSSDYEFADLKSSPHLGLKTKFGSAHSYASISELNISDSSNLRAPISHSRGGFSEVWGNGFTPYRFSELDSLGLISDNDIFLAMKEILEIIPFTHTRGELDQRFGIEDVYKNSPSSPELPLHSRYLDILQKREALGVKDGYLIGRPNLLLDSRSCTFCGLCLTGCPYGSLFDAGESINKMILRGQLKSENVLTGIVKQIDSKAKNLEVIYETKGLISKLEFDQVIVSAGALSTAMILMQSGHLPNNFQVPDSQVFYTGYFSRKRMRIEVNKPETGQIVIYPDAPNSVDFQMSCYAPSDVSQDRLSQMVVPRMLSWIKVPKIITERIIPVIGFLPQEVSGYLNIRLEKTGFNLQRVTNPDTNLVTRKIANRIKNTFRKMGFFMIPMSLVLPDPGSGFHIGASLPLGGEYVNQMGSLISDPRIKIMDSSILPKIPAGAHSFLTMALIRHLIRKSL